MKRSISLIFLLVAVFSIVLIEAGCGAGASADDQKTVVKPMNSNKGKKLKPIIEPY